MLADNLALAFAATLTSPAARIGVMPTPPPEEFFPPAQYAGLWLWILFGALAVLIAGWFTYLWLAPRPETAPEPQAPVQQPQQQLFVPTPTLRDAYIEVFDRIEHDAAVGKLSTRRAHIELSRALRQFVSDAAGIETPVLTLRQMEQHGLDPKLIKAMRGRLYPGAFAENPKLEVPGSAEVARRVVRAWN